MVAGYRGAEVREVSCFVTISVLAHVSIMMITHTSPSRLCTIVHLCTHSLISPKNGSPASRNETWRILLNSTALRPAAAKPHCDESRLPPQQTIGVETRAVISIRPCAQPSCTSPVYQVFSRYLILRPLPVHTSHSDTEAR